MQNKGSRRQTHQENEYNRVPSRLAQSGLSGFLGARIRSLQGPFVFRRVTGLCNPLTMASGVSLTTIPIDPDGTWGIQRWPTFSGLFTEFRYLRVILRTGATKGSSANSGEGFNAAYVDEADPGTNPVAADAGVHDCDWRSNACNSPSGGRFTNRLEWKPTTVGEADWLDTSSPAAPASFKIVADPTETGSSSMGSSSFLLTQLIYDLEFRQIIS